MLRGVVFCLVHLAPLRMIRQSARARTRDPGDHRRTASSRLRRKYCECHDVLLASIKGRIHPYPLISRGEATVYQSKCRIINDFTVYNRLNASHETERLIYSRTGYINACTVQALFQSTCHLRELDFFSSALLCPVL